VTDMENMFVNAYSFNQPLNNWNVSNVRDMEAMFVDARSFNQPLNNWNVSNVADMKFMFANANSQEGQIFHLAVLLTQSSASASDLN